jgi:hypothetical protein
MNTAEHFPPQRIFVHDAGLGEIYDKNAAEEH